jgi:hypothetical protein
VIALHPDPVARHEYAVMVSRRTGVESGLIDQAIRTALRSDQKHPDARDPGRSTPPPVAPWTARHSTEIELLRAILANDERLAALDLTEDLFANPDTAAAFLVARDLIAGLEPGATPDLGASIGSDDSAVSDLLRRTALDATPVADPDELVARLQVASIEAEIAATRSLLQQIDKASDEQGYSELWSRLIALEQRRRLLRNID